MVHCQNASGGKKIVDIDENRAKSFKRFKSLLQFIQSVLMFTLMFSLYKLYGIVFYFIILFIFLLLSYESDRPLLRH